MELKKLDMDDIKRRILYGLIILSLLPLITMFYINLKQDKWETDRNFYGKESSEDQLKITQNTINILKIPIFFMYTNQNARSVIILITEN